MTDDNRIEQARRKWQYNGMIRPDFAEPTGIDQESVWDYPRPPALRPDHRTIRVAWGDVQICETRCALKVMETASPPTYYMPVADVNWELLAETSKTSVCEWKGRAHYFSLNRGDAVLENCAWTYRSPVAGYEALAGMIAFYPADLTCTLGGEPVRAQPGTLYGGWITAELAGPFKGVPGTDWW